MPSLHTNTGAKRAREARVELGLEHGQPLDCVLTSVERDLGVPVVLASLPDGLTGCCVQRPGQTAVLFANGADGPPRCRFTVAHELGHVRCGHDAGVAVDTYETLHDSYDPNEVQANAFAAEFLAPRVGVEGMIDGEPTLEDVVRIAATFGVSTIAAFYRLNTLRLTSRGPRLKEEIDADEHVAVWEALNPRTIDDEIARARDHLPRISPALEGSGLDALLRGDADVSTVAAASGVAEIDLAAGAALIERRAG